MFKSTTIVKCNDAYVYIDTRDTFDAGWETMVFPCEDKDGKNVDFGTVLYQNLYSNAFEAYQGHVNAVVNYMRLLIH